MTAFSARRERSQPDPSKVRVSVYAGKDSDHLQFSGIVILYEREVDEFLARVNQARLEPKPDTPESAVAKASAARSIADSFAAHFPTVAER